ncbi:MAG: RNA-binding protein [Telluria sp.]
MPGLWMANVDTSATDDEIKDFLVRYGFPPYDTIQHVPGDGSHPAVLLTFRDAPPEALRTLGNRIQNMYWKNHKIQVHVMDRADSERP